LEKAVEGFFLTAFILFAGLVAEGGEGLMWSPGVGLLSFLSRKMSHTRGGFSILPRLAESWKVSWSNNF
jgi:hypothetical protein